MTQREIEKIEVDKEEIHGQEKNTSSVVNPSGSEELGGFKNIIWVWNI